MIDLYAWPTPNAFKVSIMLEEIGLAYDTHAVDITKGEQFAPDFLKISPNNRMPAIVDHDAVGEPLAIFESGAILMYLAEKSGQYWSSRPDQRYAAAQWIMWQMGGLGPMMGQAYHFKSYAPEPMPYALDRYTNEVKRLIGILDRQLTDREFITAEYSIADICCYPWTTIIARLDIDAADYPALVAWQERMAARPAVARGMSLLAEKRRPDTDRPDAEARENLFGRKQMERR
jgi:GST-like protein